MSTLPNNTFASPGNPFYALEGGGGGDSLQSPVNLLPEAGGNQSLNIIATTGGGEATVTISSTNGNDALLVIQNTVGGNSTLQMGTTGAGAVYFGTNGDGNIAIANAGDSIPIMEINTGGAAVTIGSTNAASTAPNSSLTLITPGSEGNATIYLNGGATDAIHFSDPTTTGIGVYQDTNTRPGQLDIGNDTAGSSVASFNQLTNIVNLGNPLSVGATYINTPTTITNSGSRPPVGGITLEQTSATNSQIAQQTAQGTLQIGSSSTFPNTLIISDAPYLGAANYVEVRGAVGQAPLFLSGAQGGANQCGIHPDAASGTAQLLIGSDNTNVDNIKMIGSNTQLGSSQAGATNTVIADTTFTLGNCIVKSILGFGGGAFNSGGTNVGAIEGFNIYQTTGVVSGSNTTVPIPQPTGAGGAAMEAGLYMILTNGTIGGTTSPTAAVSTIAYWNGTAWSYGGGGCCPALVSSPPSYFGIQATGATMSLANGSGLGAASVNVVFIQLGGVIGGL